MTIIIRDDLQRWGSNENGDAVMLSQIKGGQIWGYPRKYILAPSNHMKQVHPHCDFEHFVTRLKPWLPVNLVNKPEDVENMDVAKTTKQLWWHVLRKLNKELELGIDIENFDVGGQPSLGLYPKYEMVEHVKMAKEKKAAIEM